MAQSTVDSLADGPSPGRDHRGGRHSLLHVLRRKPVAVLAALGPGLIAGASDNDPTTVASLAVIGSTTGFGLSWLVILVIPMLVIVQTVSSTVGVCARTGLEDAIRSRYGNLWATVALTTVLAVTVLTLGADLEGGAAALSLLTGASYHWFIFPLAASVGALLIWGSYDAVQRVLRFVLLVFVLYVVAASLARPNWGDVLLHTVVPHFSFNSAYVAGAIALLGTTLTSYAYVWETIEEGESRPPLRRLGLVQVDAGLGMVIAGLIFWFILITTGATLGAHHQQVQTAQDAAQALRPLAGPAAASIFAIGLLASALLAVPVLAGTSAYVLAEALGWRRGLYANFHQAPRFYIALVVCLAIGVGLTFVGLGPIQLLFISSIAGGLATPVTLLLMMLIARDRRVMGEHRIGAWLTIAGFAITAVVAAASLLFLFQTFTGGS